MGDVVDALPCLSLQEFDDRIRSWNKNATMYSGSIDCCGWPKDPAGLGFPKRSSCFYEDFSEGFVKSRLLIAQTKTCCIKVRRGGDLRLHASVPLCLLETCATRGRVLRASLWSRLQQPIYFPNFTYYPGAPDGPDPPADFATSFKVVEDVVEYPPGEMRAGQRRGVPARSVPTAIGRIARAGVFRTKNVLQLTSINGDDTEPDSYAV